MSVWLVILLLSLILFANRYLLLEPRLPLRIPMVLQQALSYSAPCLLSSICAPIILQGGSLGSLSSSPYLYATLLSIGCAYFIKNMLLSVLASLSGFYLLLFIAFNS